ncbi:uncharacterized protein LOC125238673 [Leguminivora glycinivorella]|uniref:uncharacterized protein LOC125238673 n=1 Tax=Leguminivora glycinivorella TaxID=1035111 RepID=UPI00200D4132|nr:uncharacterized protein LOC125238673 [Leguminivora glycinivorella]
MARMSVCYSSRSITSHRMNYMNDAEELTDAELIKAVNDLKHQIKITNLENDILERTIMRLEPSLMTNIQQAIDYASKLASSPSLGGSFMRSQTSKFDFSPSKILSSPSRASTRRVESSAKIGGTTVFGSGARINVMARSELVSTEMELLMQKLANARKRAAKQHAMLKAQLEEIELRVVDIEKASVAFNQEVIVDGWDKLAQRIPAEIWIRYMTEWMKICDSQIGKLRLRTSTLNTQHAKFKGQIKVKAELNDRLRPVDFDKIKIENQEALATIDQKTKQLEELKKMTGDANLNLTVHKKAMWEQNSYLAKIFETIKTKQRQTVAIDKERGVIQVEADALAARLTEVKKVRNAYEVPDIMEYVEVKAALGDLQKGAKLLENRLRVQHIALTSLQSKLRIMKA